MLYKTTIVIWSGDDPSDLELVKLVEEASSGASYCSSMKTKEVENPKADPDWDGTEFFDLIEDEEEEEET